MRETQASPTRYLSKGDGLKSKKQISEHVRLRSVRHQIPVRTTRNYRRRNEDGQNNSLCEKRSLRSAENARRRPKTVPIYVNRATLAALHKTSQRGLLAYMYTYPVPVESSRGTSFATLRNASQPYASSRECWSRSYQTKTRAIKLCSRACKENSPCASRHNDVLQSIEDTTPGRPAKSTN